MSNNETVPPPLGQGVRYTILITLKPGARGVQYRVVTSLGELKAAALAALRLLRDQPEARFSTVEVVGVETDFTTDPEHDLLDYWGLE